MWTDDEARAKVAEYMGWVRCPDEAGKWHVGGVVLSTPTFDAKDNGWWEFGQLVEAWKRDAIEAVIDLVPQGAVVTLTAYAEGSDSTTHHTGDADSLPEAAYRATVKMLEACDD